MRAWLAVPLVGKDKQHYGLLQLSAKYNDAAFTEDDEPHPMQLARPTAALDVLQLYQESSIGQPQE